MNAWRGRRVLVTGHTGFKGSWLCLMLRQLDATVAGFSLAPEPGSLHVAAGVSAASTIADVRDLAALRACIDSYKPEVVFHLAAQSLVRPSYSAPLDTFAVNVQGTANVLEACRGQDAVRAIVIVTSDKCYLNREWTRGYREDDALGGRDPYSASKAAAEIVTASWRDSFYGSGAAVASARSGNVIGGGDWSVDRLVPDAVRAFAAGQALQVRNPDSTRPWQHVLDPLNGYLILAERLLDQGRAFAEPWNFGPAGSDDRSVREVVEKLCAAWPDASWNHDRADHSHEARLLKLDCAKAMDRLAWKPLLPFDEALAWTADWYRDWQRGANLADRTCAQIETYFRRAGRDA